MNAQMTDVPQCSERVQYTDFHFRNCSRNGVVQRAGVWFCKQHDPVAIIERDRKRYDKAVRIATARNGAADAQLAKAEATAELVKAALEHWDHPAVDRYRATKGDST